MTTKAWIIFAAVVVVLFGGLIYFSNQNRLDVSDINNAVTQQANERNGEIADHVFGKADSKVVFVEYGDFQCPGCGSAFPRIKTLTEKYEGQIAFVFRNFPITTIHPNARLAAATAEAAGLQGKYWEMHTLLYENQKAWESLGVNERGPYFESLARQLELDIAKYSSDLASDKVSQKIAFDLAVGKKAGVSGTPAFYLNGKAIEQDVWADDAKLEAAIVDELKRQGIEPPVATPAE